MARSLLDRVEIALAYQAGDGLPSEGGILEMATQVLRKLVAGEYLLVRRTTLEAIRDELKQHPGGSMAGRSIALHRTTGAAETDLNEQLQIEATDDPGPGGANHEYRISWKDRYGNLRAQDVKFQKGGVNEKRTDLGGAPINGVNAPSREAYLAIVLDGLQAFQAGPFACDANAQAVFQAWIRLFGEPMPSESAASVDYGDTLHYLKANGAIYECSCGLTAIYEVAQ